MLKSFLKIFFSCILALFLAILALGAGLCHYGHTVVCNPDTLQKIAVDSGYTQQLYEEIVYDWENYLAITGVETPETIMVVLTQEQVDRDALQYISDAYTGKATVNTDALRSSLDSKVRQYAHSHNIYETPDEELEQNIQDLVDACIDDYTSAIAIPMLVKILSTIHRYGAMLLPCLIGLCIGNAVLLAFLFFLQKKKQDVLYYSAIATATGSIILLAIPKLAAHYNIVNRLPVSESAMKTLVKSYLETILNAIGSYGNIFLIATIILLALYIAITVSAALLKHRAGHASGECTAQEPVALAETVCSDEPSEE